MDESGFKWCRRAEFTPTIHIEEVLQLEKCIVDDKLRMGLCNACCINMSLGIWLDVSVAFSKDGI